INSGWYILGDRLKRFESEYASYNDVAFCIGLGNGLDALVLGLKALNIGPGDEVIVPSNTYIASWLAVSYVGATIVPVEPNIETYNINAQLIEAKITMRTRVIMPVNLYGQAAELDKIDELAKKYNLFVIEDNAQSQGASCQGKLTGSFGQINATSFYPGKNLGCLGDGGAITTNNPALAEKVEILRNYGSPKKYYNTVKGHNSRLDELQAAFLSVKLRELNNDNAKRIVAAQWYNEALHGVGDLILPKIAPGCTSVYHLYVIRTARRDEMQKFLAKNNVGSVIHYPTPPHLQEAYRDLAYKKGDFPIAEEIADTCLSLPIWPSIESTQVLDIAEKIKLFFK
ncbi:MAG TPA: DegT/DnrJ/EryC1/StrS family aminotransferase, partial [Cytophagaceae bacterium]